MPVRVALVVESDACHPAHRRNALITALTRELANCMLFPVNGNHVRIARDLHSRRSDFDCILTFLYFDALYAARAAFKDVELPLVVIEHDASLNYSTTHRSRGQLSAFLDECPDTLLVLSGTAVCARLRAEGHNCFYSPKAAPAAFLSYANRHTGFYCLFGSHRDPVYQQRAALYRQLAPWRPIDLFARALPVTTAWARQFLASRRNEVAIHRLHFPFSQMPRLLSRYSGCVVCDQGLFEPMAKHFEASALGLVVFRDGESLAELQQLGYRDGESMVIYHDIEDLHEKLRYYQREPAALKKLQRGARRASAANTWEQRAHELRLFLEKRF